MFLLRVPAYPMTWHQIQIFNSLMDASHFATLTAPGWSKTWSIGEGKNFPSNDGTHPYLYYIVEVGDDGNAYTIDQETDKGYKLIGYSQNNSEGISSQGTIIVYNELETPKKSVLRFKSSAKTTLRTP